MKKDYKHTRAAKGGSARTRKKKAASKQNGKIGGATPHPFYAAFRTAIATEAGAVKLECRDWSIMILLRREKSGKIFPILEMLTLPELQEILGERDCIKYIVQGIRQVCRATQRGMK